MDLAQLVSQEQMQSRALELADGPFRDLVKNDDRRGHLVHDQARKQVSPQCLLAHLKRRSKHHGGDQVFAQGGMGDTESDSLSDRRVLEQCVVNFARRDLLAAAIDDLSRSPSDEDVSVSVTAREIAGLEPSILEGRRIRGFVVVVAVEHAWTANHDLPSHAVRAFAA